MKIVKSVSKKDAKKEVNKISIALTYEKANEINKELAGRCFFCKTTIDGLKKWGIFGHAKTVHEKGNCIELVGVCDVCWGKIKDCLVSIERRDK